MTEFNKPVGHPPIAGPGLARSVKIAYVGPILLPNTLAAADTVDLFTLPPGSKLIGAQILSEALDSASAGNQTLTFDMGDTVNGTASIMSASKVGQNGGSDLAMLAKATGFVYVVDTPIILTVHTAAATKAAGNISAFVEYLSDGLPTS